MNRHQPFLVSMTSGPEIMVIFLLVTVRFLLVGKVELNAQKDVLNKIVSMLRAPLFASIFL